MTLNELSQLYHLNREIEDDKKRLSTLENSLFGAGAPANIKDEIADLKAIVMAKIEQSIHERSRLERYIASIPDSLTRRIFALRFINGMSWIQVALEIGGGNTDNSCRMICMRYLKKQR